MYVVQFEYSFWIQGRRVLPARDRQSLNIHQSIDHAKLILINLTMLLEDNSSHACASSKRL